MIQFYATTEDVLEFRDRRCEIQQELLGKYRLSLISFTLNIAGPKKRTPLTELLFERTLVLLKDRLGEPVYLRELRTAAGSAAFLVYDILPETLKEECQTMEETSRWGRLLDLDVLTPAGEKLSRGEGRRCIICGGPVWVCSRSRAHGLTVLEEKTRELLCVFASDTLADFAVSALRNEALLSPKPGLVDSLDSGAHTDMDIALMLKSADALRTYFKNISELVFGNEEDLPAKLQQAGIDAEKQMLRATGGVNTHKGAIYTLGLLCAAQAMYLSDGEGDVLGRAGELAVKLSAGAEPSHGETVRKHLPDSGPRFEAQNGFPHVKRAAALIGDGIPPLDVLLDIISTLDDTNVIWRGGAEGLEYLKNAAADILSAPAQSHEELTSKLNRECIKRRLSPGGAADLFSAALFMNYLDFSGEN